MLLHSKHVFFVFFYTLNENYSTFVIIKQKTLCHSKEQVSFRKLKSFAKHDGRSGLYDISSESLSSRQYILIYLHIGNEGSLL